MTIAEILRDHLREHRSRTPFTTADLAIIASQKAGRKVSEGDAANAIMGGMLDGWAEEDGDGWMWREEKREPEKMLF